MLWTSSYTYNDLQKSFLSTDVTRPALTLLIFYPLTPGVSPHSRLDKAVDIGSLNVSYLINEAWWVSWLFFQRICSFWTPLNAFIHQPLLPFSPFWEDICLCPPLFLRSGVFKEDFVFSFMGGKFIEYFLSSPPTMWWWEEEAQGWELGAMVLILIVSLTSERTLSQPFLFLLGVSVS